MTPAEQLAVLTPEHSVLEAMDLMVRYNVRHVPVVSVTWGTWAVQSSTASTEQQYKCCTAYHRCTAIP
jgi:hypothetical protein